MEEVFIILNNGNREKCNLELVQHRKVATKAGLVFCRLCGLARTTMMPVSWLMTGQTVAFGEVFLSLSIFSLLRRRGRRLCSLPLLRRLRWVFLGGLIPRRRDVSLRDLLPRRFAAWMCAAV